MTPERLLMLQHSPISGQELLNLWNFSVLDSHTLAKSLWNHAQYKRIFMTHERLPVLQQRRARITWVQVPWSSTYPWTLGTYFSVRGFILRAK